MEIKQTKLTLRILGIIITVIQLILLFIEREYNIRETFYNFITDFSIKNFNIFSLIGLILIAISYSYHVEKK